MPQFNAINHHAEESRTVAVVERVWKELIILLNSEICKAIQMAAISAPFGPFQAIHSRAHTLRPSQKSSSSHASWQAQARMAIARLVGSPGSGRSKRKGNHKADRMNPSIQAKHTDLLRAKFGVKRRIWEETRDRPHSTGCHPANAHAIQFLA